jgi:hypothetical protein
MDVTYPMPSCFTSLEDIRMFVISADVSYIVNGCRWDIIDRVENNKMRLYGMYDDSLTDGDFEIDIEYTNNILHYHIQSVFNSPDVVPFVVNNFLPAFNRFPKNYSEL